MCEPRVRANVKECLIACPPVFFALFGLVSGSVCAFYSLYERRDLEVKFDRRCPILPSAAISDAITASTIPPPSFHSLISFLGSRVP